MTTNLESLQAIFSKQMFIQKLDQQTGKVPGILKPEFQRLAKGWILSYPED